MKFELIWKHMSTTLVEMIMNKENGVASAAFFYENFSRYFLRLLNIRDIMCIFISYSA